MTTTPIPRRAALSLLGLPVLLAACASAEPAYFRLEAVSGPTRQGAPRLVELRRTGLARYLDRAEIVRGGGPTRIELLPDARWAEPLGEMTGRVLAENLTRRLPGTTVFSEGTALSIESDMVAEVEIQRFEDDGSGRVVLMAQIAVRGEPRGRRAARAVRLEAPVEGGGTSALVTAMSQALGQLADALAQMLAVR